MSKYATLIAQIAANIRRNGAQAITGDLLQEQLLAMITSLGEYYQFGGLASPSAEFTPGDEPVVFVAATPGTYTNFGGLVVADSEVALLVWDGSAWSKQTTDIATRTEVSQLGQKIMGLDVNTSTDVDSVGRINVTLPISIPKNTQFRIITSSESVVITGNNGTVFMGDVRVGYFNSSDDRIYNSGENSGSITLYCSASAVSGTGTLNLHIIIYGEITYIKESIKDLSEDLSETDILARLGLQLTKEQVISASNRDILFGVKIPAHTSFRITFSCDGATIPYNGGSVLLHKQDGTTANVGSWGTSTHKTYNSGENSGTLSLYFSATQITGTGTLVAVLEIISTGAYDLRKINSANLVDNLQNQVYDLNEDWLSSVESINTEKGTAFTFAIQTDTHFKNVVEGGNDVANNLKRLTQVVGFDFVCNLGDIIQGYEGDTIEEMRQAMTIMMSRYTTNISCPFFATQGNHDWMPYGDSHMSEQELIGRMIVPVQNTARIIRNGNSPYYYYDFADVRVIVLDTYENNSFNISNTQLSWLVNTALNTEKQVLIMTHIPLVSDLSSDASIINNGAETLSAINNFKNNGGIVIACCYGHTHTQNSVIVNGIPHITFMRNNYACEILMVDTENRTIQTRKFPTNAYGMVDRSFTY